MSSFNKYFAYWLNIQYFSFSKFNFWELATGLSWVIWKWCEYLIQIILLMLTRQLVSTTIKDIHHQSIQWRFTLFRHFHRSKKIRQNRSVFYFVFACFSSSFFKWTRSSRSVNSSRILEAVIHTNLITVNIFLLVDINLNLLSFN